MPPTLNTRGYFPSPLRLTLGVVGPNRGHRIHILFSVPAVPRVGTRSHPHAPNRTRDTLGGASAGVYVNSPAPLVPRMIASQFAIPFTGAKGEAGNLFNAGGVGYFAALRL